MNSSKALRVLIVACVFFAVFMSYSLVQRRDADRRERCLRQLAAIEGAKEQYALEHEGAAPASFEVLIPRYLEVRVACPANGRYILGDMQTGVVCSVAAHVVNQDR